MARRILSLFAVLIFQLHLSYNATATATAAAAAAAAPDLMSITNALTDTLNLDDAKQREERDKDGVVNALDSDYLMLYTSPSRLNDAILDADVGRCVCQSGYT